ncbi:MAG: hypothetical protein ACJ790_05345 [Myxococcaceae bacterium]
MRFPLLIAALFVGTAFAQSPPPTSLSAQNADAQAQAQPEEKPSEVPDREKLTRSAEALTRMRDVLRETLQKVEEARNTKDVVKLNCVNEKLTQIKGLLRISEQADVALQEAIAKGEAAAADHEFTKVTIARQKVEQQMTEAEECIGQLAFRTDEQQQIEVQEPSYLPDDDPSNPETPTFVITRPPPASPTL